MGLSTALGFLIVLLFFYCVPGDDLQKGCVDFRTYESPFTDPAEFNITQKGYLYSPGFEESKNYPDMIGCTYILRASPGKHVRIQFNVLDIEVTGGCVGDFLRIYDTDSDDDNPEITSTLCGNHTPYDYVSQSSGLFIMFRTDEFASRKGYNITYMPQDNSSVCLLGQKQCRNRKCIQQSVVCDGNDDCEDGSDEEKCPGIILPTTECGRPEVEPITLSDLDRIVGGREAEYGSWPWMASLQMQSIEPDGHLCGGSLINAQWVLTASHCFVDQESWNASYWRIHLGKQHKSVKDTYEQVRYAEKIIIFPDFPPEEFEKHGGLNIAHDLALIKLNAPVLLTKYVKPVCLADPKLQLSSASNCYVTGWGQTRGSGSSDELKQSPHPVQPAGNCQKYIKDVFDPETMICAGSMGTLNGVCHGDSGGPLVCKNSTNSWSIVGVASFVTDTTGEGLGLCGLEGRPSVFNRVYLENDWIYEVVDYYS